MQLPLEGLAGLPRKKLWHEPTPIENLPRLAEAAGASQLLVKRDDCNGLAFGGNKIRQMEYYLGDALSKGCDTLLITGAVQSNFVRSAAAASAKNGLECHIQLENRVPKESETYNNSGNVMLDRLLGAHIHYYPEGEDEEGADRQLEELADGLRKDGKTPYVVHLHPSHPPLGALGYIDCAAELLLQLDGLKITPDIIFVPSGSGNTHGGFLYGMRALGSSIPVHGSCVRRAASEQQPRIEKRLEQIAELLEEQSSASADDVILTDEHLAPEYGKLGASAKEAISLSAKLEALILDPVYTGKTMAAAIAWSRKNPGKTILFLHTGGGPAIFGYGEEMMAAANS